MNIKIGHLIWGVSILIFLIFAYGQNTFNRVWDIFTGESPNVIHIQKFVPSEKITIVPESEENLDKSEVSIDGIDKIIEEEFKLNSELHLQMELLKYKVQRLEDDYGELKKEMKKSNEEKNESMDNILAIMTTLLPIAIPYFTRKNHNKEITVFKREVTV